MVHCTLVSLFLLNLRHSDSKTTLIVVASFLSCSRVRWSTSFTAAVYHCKHGFQYFIVTPASDFLCCGILSRVNSFRYFKADLVSVYCSRTFSSRWVSSYWPWLPLILPIAVPISVFLFTLPLPYLGVASSLPPGFVAGAIILVLGMLIYTWRPLNRLNNQGVDNCHC